MAYPITSDRATAWPTNSAAANPAYTGIFIPAVWSAKLIEKFYDSTVLAAMSNTDYEGEIRNQGDTVKIRTKPSISINDYTADLNLAVERPSSNIVELLIDKGKYFNTILDDVMEVQSDIDQLSMWADDASEQMKITIDTDVLANVNADIFDTTDASGAGWATGSSGNQGATAGRISANIDLGTVAAPLQMVARNPTAAQTEVVDLITYLGQVLDEANIPETGRWMIAPAWFCSLVKRSELRDASLTGDSVGIARNGRLGMIDRFTLYMSNLLPTDNDATAGDSYRIYAGHSHGLTFASQLTKVETLRAESTFGTLLRGLQVYGYKVVDGTALALAQAQKV
jgi:hypothetical protein